MENIIYRHYQEGDEEQLANLFNLAFQMNGYGIVRTPKNWNWRYLQSPNFEAEMCQIAEDKNEKKIVGAIYVNLVEKISLYGKNFSIGDINDVSCHPAYTKKGIATNLMKMAVDYMKKKGCDFSILAANYSFAKEKIYLKFGYLDVDSEYNFLQFPNIFKLIKDMPVFAILYPISFSISYIPRFLNRLRTKVNTFFKNVSYEILYNKKHVEYMNAANKIIPKYYTGFINYNKKKFEWARIKVPAKRHKPTYVIMRKKNEIIGGAVITHQNIYAFKYGIKIRIGMIHELFLDKSRFDNQKNLHLGYIYLIDKIMKAATRRIVGALIYQSTTKDHDLHKAFRSMNFLKFRGETIMMKTLKENVKIPKFKKPLFVPTYVSIGVP